HGSHRWHAGAGGSTVLAFVRRSGSPPEIATASAAPQRPRLDCSSAYRVRRGRGDRVNRRQLITLLGGAAAWPLAAAAEQAKVRRIGFLRAGPPPPAFIGGFREGLREQGFSEGRDFVIDFALASSAAQVPPAAAELVRGRGDLLVAAGTPAGLPAPQAARPKPG